jgi:hypothetical protein
MKRILLSASLIFSLLLPATAPSQAWEVTPPSWAGEISTPPTFQWGNWLPCLPEYREFDCIDSVYWVKESGEKVAGKWAPTEWFDYSTFKAKYVDHPDGYSLQYLDKSIFGIGSYEFEGLVTPCSEKPNVITIDVRAARAAFQVNASGAPVGNECAWFQKKFEERFEVTLKSANLKGLVGGVSSNGRSPSISFSEAGGFGFLTISARFAYMPWNNGDSEFEFLDVCKKNLERARSGGWGLWNQIFFVSRPSGNDELLRVNPGDMITGTNGWNCGGNLRWDPSEGALVMQVGAPHYDVDGSVVDGWFEGSIRGRYIKSRFGIEPTQAAGNARLEVVYTDGEVKVATISATYDSSSDVVSFNAFGFTYSAPVLKLTFGKKATSLETESAASKPISEIPSKGQSASKAKTKKAVSCVKSGKVKKFNSNKCPKGYKRA